MPVAEIPVEHGQCKVLCGFFLVFQTLRLHYVQEHFIIRVEHTPDTVRVYDRVTVHRPPQRMYSAYVLYHAVKEPLRHHHSPDSHVRGRGDRLANLVFHYYQYAWRLHKELPHVDPYA